MNLTESECIPAYRTKKLYVQIRRMQNYDHCKTFIFAQFPDEFQCELNNRVPIFQQKRGLQFGIKIEPFINRNVSTI